MTYVALGPDEHREVRVQLDDGLWVPDWLVAYRKASGPDSSATPWASGRRTSAGSRKAGSGAESSAEERLRLAMRTPRRRAAAWAQKSQ